MLSKKFFLLTTAVLALGVAASACAGGDDDDDGGTFELTSGEYSLDEITVPAATNTCWPSPMGDALIATLSAVALPVEIISTNGTTFSIVMPDIADEILPSVDGTITGNDLAASGNAPGLVVGSGCTMSIAATADGVLTDDNEFDVSLTANLSVPQADAADCAVFVGESIPGTEDLVPFPILTETSSGTCTVTLDAIGYPDV